jgi:hypothetical protein
MIRLDGVTRWKASAIHLGFSCAAASMVAVLVFFIWFPRELLKATGGLDLFSVVMSVDVILGPLMTLVVFNPRKKSLKFDLAVIALLQIGALAYGLYVVSQARPLYVVFTIDRFDVVTSADISPIEWAKVGDSRYRSAPWFGPKYVAAKNPSDESERQIILFSSLNGGADLQDFPKYYVPYQVLASQAAKQGKPVESLIKHRPQEADLIERFLAQRHLIPSQVVFLPLRAKRGDMSAMLHVGTGDILGFLPVDPWI